MSRKNPADKLADKRASLLERTASIFNCGQTEALAMLSQARRQSLRLNPLKAVPERTLDELRAAGWRGEPFDWAENGYTIDSPPETVRDSRPVLDGEAFIQNAASWLPVLALDPRPGEKVLDVCAAPGGKTSHIAAITCNQASLWANDSSKARLHKMRANLERLNAKVEKLTLFDAQKLAAKLPGEQFDKILIDAPCSSEGLRDINSDKDMRDWSVSHIKRLQREQKNIIRQAWQLLKPGGTLVYSTCTMAPEENEAVADYLLRSRPDARILPLGPDLPNRVPPVSEWNGRQFSPQTSECLRLKPSEHLEAFFVCKFKKDLQ